MILKFAKDIDAELAAFATGFPDHLRYTTKECRVNEDVLADYYHVYPNTWVVTGYNLYRSARVMTHELIIRWLSHNQTFEGGDTQQRESELTLARLNAEICASVPFILGYAGDLEQIPLLPRAAGGLALVWPLYLAATMDTVTASTRAWVISRLDKLGHLMGIQQAVTLANVLRTKTHITAWERFESTRIDEELNDW